MVASEIPGLPLIHLLPGCPRISRSEPKWRPTGKKLGRRSSALDVDFTDLVMVNENGG